MWIWNKNWQYVRASIANIISASWNGTCLIMYKETVTENWPVLFAKQYYQREKEYVSDDKVRKRKKKKH